MDNKLDLKLHLSATMDTVNTSQTIKMCVDELHKHFVKTLMPDYQFASLVAVLAKAGKKHCQNQGESIEIAELVHDEVYGRGLERWIQSVTKAHPSGALDDAELESSLLEFDYMFRQGRERPKTISRTVNKKSKAKQLAKKAGTD